MKLNENNERFLRTMAEAGKTDMVLGLFRQAPARNSCTLHHTECAWRAVLCAKWVWLHSTTSEFDINAADDAGNTALHKAASNGHIVVCHILYKRGADLAKKNKHGHTAQQLAVLNKHAMVVNFFRQPESVAPFIVEQGARPQDPANGARPQTSLQDSSNGRGDQQNVFPALPSALGPAHCKPRAFARPLRCCSRIRQ